MHQKSLHCIADTGTLNLGVRADSQGHLQVRVGIHIRMAQPFIVFDDRYPGTLADQGN